MAFLSGEKHRLYLGEETTWGEVPANNLTNANWNQGFVAYTRPGSRPSLQGGIIPGVSLGQVMGFGRTRTSVSGSFSFYLPTYAYIDQKFGFMTLFKHLYGIVGAYDSSTTFTSSQLENAPTASGANGNHSIRSTFTKADVAVHDHTSDDTNRVGLSLLSVYDDNEIYLYRGACITGMNIVASDPNSLVTVDVSFIARDITKCYLDNTIIKTRHRFYDDTDDFDDISTSTTEVTVLTGFGTSMKTHLTGDANTSSSGQKNPFFQSLYTYLSLKLGQVTTAGTAFDASGQTALIETFSSGIAGVNISIVKPMAFTGLFGGIGSGASYRPQTDSNNSNSRPNFTSVRMRQSRPVLSGNKTISGSFTFPVDKRSGGQTYSSEISNNFNVYENLLRYTTGEVNASGETPLKIGFRTNGTSITSNSLPDGEQRFLFEFDNVIFGVSDFTNLSTNIATSTVNWTAVAKNTTADNSTPDRTSTATLAYHHTS
jgi:hypothetical protein